MPDDARQADEVDRVTSRDDTEQGWGPNHPCYNGHKIIGDPTTCERCGRELEKNPIGRWRSVETYEDGGRDE